MDNVLVTGFGPFNTHKINASWEAVKLLPQKINSFNVITVEIPVSYENVDREVQRLWEQYTPKLVIHVGVSDAASKITLESCAYKDGYIRKDHFGNTPNGALCGAECEDSCIRTEINIKHICARLNESVATKAMVSENAGRFLCEYTFFTSLSIDRKKTIFIHVPPLGKPYSAQELANALVEVIKCVMENDDSNININQIK